jgi:N-acetylmuramoyl-L-alanine amidase
MLSQVMDAETVARSTHFAGLLQRASMASLQPAFSRVSDGGVRQAGFFVLAGAQMPAVLFEVSFISNTVEEQRLDSVLYRQRLADGIVNAIRAYREGL